MNSNLENLPSNVLKRIISFLPLNGILNLMTTSEILYNICNSNDVWKSIFNRFFKSFCSAEDYEKTSSNNNNNSWKALCIKVLIENEDGEDFQEFITGHANYETDCEQESSVEARLKLSIARTNLLQHIEIHDIESDDDDSSAESFRSVTMEDLIDIKEIHKSISSSSNESFQFFNVDNSSKTNLLAAPSSSSISLNENVKCHEVFLSSPANAQTHNNDDEDRLNLGFTRNELKRRLENLVKLANKNFNGDVESLLPATKYGKFALRYRDE